MGAILEFAEALRRREIPVTIGEIVDALEGTSKVPLGERDLFRNVLRTTLVKKAEHIPEFERLFDLHFCGLPGPSGTGVQGDSELPQAVRDLLKEKISGLSPLSSLLISGNGLSMERMVGEAARAVKLSQIEYPLQAGSFVRRMNEHLGLEGAKEELELFFQALMSNGLGEKELQGLKEMVKRNQELLQGLLRSSIRNQLEKNKRLAKESFLIQGLMGKSFSSLSEQEIEDMRGVIASLVRKLRTKIASVDRRHKMGRLQIRKTLRRNMEYGGIPFEMVFRVKKRRKSRVMALCDVSSSVWTASRFMLNLLYAIQDQFSEVRSFIFVSELGEVTGFFKIYPPNEAIQKALREASIRYHSYSDYGDVLLEFREKYLGEVNYRTIVIIIGDGRNNYLPTRSWVLGEIRERCRKLIWLNPEPSSMWGTGDSAMWEYAPFCTEVEECRNLKQLGDFIDRLIM